MSERALQEALLKIRNDKQFAPLKEWLTLLREASRDRLETASDRVQVEQGKSQILKLLISSIESAPEMLNKLK